MDESSAYTAKAQLLTIYTVNSLSTRIGWVGGGLWKRGVTPMCVICVVVHISNTFIQCKLSPHPLPVKACDAVRASGFSLLPDISRQENQWTIECNYSVQARQ